MFQYKYVILLLGSQCWKNYAWAEGANSEHISALKMDSHHQGYYGGIDAIGFWHGCLLVHLLHSAFDVSFGIVERHWRQTGQKAVALYLWSCSHQHNSDYSQVWVKTKWLACCSDLLSMTVFFLDVFLLHVLSNKNISIQRFNPYSHSNNNITKGNANRCW